MKSVKKRTATVPVVLGILVLAVIVSAVAALCLGSQPYSLAQLWQALCTRGEQDPVWRVIAYVRLPRMLGGLFSGAALAVAGVLLQAVLNNAMASPNVIGVNAGAGFFALFAMVVAPTVPGAMQFASFLGALGCSMLVYLLAWRAGLSRTTLVLAGLAVSGMLTAGINTLKLLWPEIVASSPGFLTGGLSGVTMSMLAAAFPYFVLGILLALFLTVDLNVLCLGEESAAGLGLHVTRTRFLGILAAALLAGSAVSFAGLLSFVGLLAPHIARRLVGTDHRILVPASALLGAAFVVVCDIAARLLFAPFELPVGILLSLIGGPFFLSLLLHRKRGRIYV
ncbi:iron ABC transporter permease [Subdoligranulum variabile]|uniref:FecCD family ABC transporter permease n=1 Tax=Subdoligranulum variabile TaxID=214851 RepID=UPI002943AAF5|nr:iron ABC transporter permease [Subdoligranulum variabile]